MVLAGSSLSLSLFCIRLGISCTSYIPVSPKLEIPYALSKGKALFIIHTDHQTLPVSIDDAHRSRPQDTRLSFTLLNCL